MTRLPRSALFSAVAVLGLALTVVAAPARAAPIAYQLELTVTSNAGNAFGIVGTGGVFTATVDLDPTLTVGAAGNAANFYLDLNGSIFQTDPVSPAGAALHFHGANVSGGGTALPFDAGDPNGFRDYILRINQTSSTSGPSNSAFDGLAISGLSSEDITWGAWDASAGQSLSGTFTIAVAPLVAVPAPAGAAALLGLACLVVARRRTSRRASDI